MTPADLRAAIAASGLSQAAFAIQLGLAPRTIRHWLAGDRKIPAWLPIVLKSKTPAGS